MNTQHLDLLTKACDEIVAAKEAIANAESKIAYIREQIQNTAAQQSQANQSTLSAQSQTNATAPKSLSDIPQPRVSRVKEILERGKKVTNEGGVPKFEEIPSEGVSKFGYTTNNKITKCGATSFSNNDLGNVRIVLQDNEPMFCLSDVAKILEHSNPRSIKEWLDNEFGDGVTKSYAILDSLGREQKATFITEPQLYYVLARTNAPKAKPFRMWVNSEVLPSIRKTGTYQIDSPQQQSIDESLKRYEALFGGKFSVQTPCKQFIEGITKLDEEFDKGGRLNLHPLETAEGITKSYTLNTKEATIENSIKTFSNENLGSVRTILKDTEPLFCLSDIAKILEIQNIRQLKPMLDEEFDKGGIFYIHPLRNSWR